MLMIVVSKSTKINKNHHLGIIMCFLVTKNKNMKILTISKSRVATITRPWVTSCVSVIGIEAVYLIAAARQHASLGSRRSKIEQGIDQNGWRTNCLIKLRGGRSDLDEVAFQHLGGGGGDQMIDSGGSDH